MKTRQKYVAVNGAWPMANKDLPPLTPAMALKAFRALHLHRFGKRWTGPVKVVRGKHRRTGLHWLEVGRGRRQRMVLTMVLGPDRGWHSFIHDLSHWVHHRQYPHQSAHRASSHPAVEMDLIEQVVWRGWLGELKPAPDDDLALARAFLSGVNQEMQKRLAA